MPKIKATAMGLLGLPSTAQAQPNHHEPPQRVTGVGQIQLDEPNVVGDRICTAVAGGFTVHGG
ncbi:hypothetical protein [Cryptosporangium sp. NPDC048952]|uniref:hypothetical protein n=1 Tax=Cryptosporangium sp. NPDC048952 TaxID=3363961 RepID=UPI0037200591